jgi:hypothetical protein
LFGGIGLVVFFEEEEAAIEMRRPIVGVAGNGRGIDVVHDPIEEPAAFAVPSITGRREGNDPQLVRILHLLEAIHGGNDFEITRQR